MKYITPAIEQAGWDIKKQVRAEYTFTDGRVIVRGNVTTRGKKTPKSAPDKPLEKKTRRKPLLSTYEPDKRLDSWLKVKKDYNASFDTLDLIPGVELRLQSKPQIELIHQKAVQHTTGGYLLYAALTHERVFDYRPGEIYWCTADVGWVTSHTAVTAS